MKYWKMQFGLFKFPGPFGPSLLLLSTLFLFVNGGKLKTTGNDQLSKRTLRLPLTGRSDLLEPARLIRNSDGSAPRVEVQAPLIAQISLGEPEQTFRLAFNTLTSNMWLESVNCSGCDEKTRRYDDSKSSSYQPNGRLVGYQSPRSAVIGFLSTDNLVIGKTKVENQTFVEITGKDGVFENLEIDGYFGLGHRFKAVENVATPLDNLLSQKLISEKVVSLYRAKFDPSEQLTSKGEVIFGGIDETKFTGDMSYVSSLPYDWSFRTNRIAFSTSDGEMNVCPLFGCRVFLNTVSPFTKGPREEIKKLNGAIGAKELSAGGGIYRLPSCKIADISKLPDLDFDISGRIFSIKPYDYVIGAYDEAHQELICLSTLVEHDDNIFVDDIEWTLGAAFIGTSYTVLDYENKQIGFANLK